MHRHVYRSDERLVQELRQELEAAHEVRAMEHTKMMAMEEELGESKVHERTYACTHCTAPHCNAQPWPPGPARPGPGTHACAHTHTHAPYTTDTCTHVCTHLRIWKVKLEEYMETIRKLEEGIRKLGAQLGDAEARVCARTHAHACTHARMQTHMHAHRRVQVRSRCSRPR